MEFLFLLPFCCILKAKSFVDPVVPRPFGVHLREKSTTMDTNRDDVNNPQDKIGTHPATRIREGKRESINEKVAKETILRIFLNQQEIVALSCSPSDQKYLAIGFLFSEGFLKTKDQIERIDLSEDRVMVRADLSGGTPDPSKLRGVLTSGCGKGKSFGSWKELDPVQDILIDMDFALSPDQIMKVMLQFEKRSELFRQTAGVHSAALADGTGIAIFNEDIGRHNAVDKVLGQALLKGIELKDKFLVISGRISSEIVSKLWKSRVSTVVSRTAPTSLAVEMAQRLGITLVGFARGRRMTVFSFPVRIRE